MMSKREIVCVLLVGAAILFQGYSIGCSEDHALNDGVDAAADGDSDTDTDGDSDTDTDTDADTDSTCLGIGDVCTTGADCCTGSCEKSGAGGFICTSAQRCTALGDSCRVAADCCSLGCDGSRCIDSLCLVKDEPCGGDAQCCSNRCVDNACESGGACLPVGEDCSNGGASSCCSLNCTPASDGNERCMGIGRCRSEGEVCSDDKECCNYQCQGGFCFKQKECDVAGEACSETRACCSGVCANDGSGYYSCQYIGGCRPYGEICRSDEECCNNPAFSGPGVCDPINEEIGRCLNPNGCAPAGELCGSGYHDCCPCSTPDKSPGCPNENGDLFCQETVFGVERCFSDDCVLKDGECDGDEDCCGGVCTDGVCNAGLECLPDLEACAFSDQCCCQICAPDDDGDLVCCPGEETCMPAGDKCMSDADCCSGNCNSDGICGPGENACIPVGGPCTNPEDCCSNYCNTMTGSCSTDIVL